MADSTREAAIKALLALLEGISGPTVLRNAAEDTKIPEGGLIVLRDGDPGEPDVLLSPVSYGYAHRAECVIQVTGDSETARAEALDAILQDVGQALANDETLSGAVEMATPEAPEFDDEPVEGGKTVKAAVVPVILEYATATPLA